MSRGGNPRGAGALSGSRPRYRATASGESGNAPASERSSRLVVAIAPNSRLDLAGGGASPLTPTITAAARARRWNDANVLALSLRTTSDAVLDEILDAWFSGEPSAEADDRANVGHLAEI